MGLRLGKQHRDKKRWLFFFSLIMLLSPLCLFAGGAGDPNNTFIRNEFEEASQLIENKHFNEALDILTNLIREYPEQIERVQNLIRETRKSRNKINDSFELFNEAFLSENLEQAESSIQVIQSEEKDPDLSLQEDILYALRAINKLKGNVSSGSAEDLIVDDLFANLEEWNTVYNDAYKAYKRLIGLLEEGVVSEEWQQPVFTLADSLKQLDDNYIRSQNLTEQLNLLREQLYTPPNGNPEDFQYDWLLEYIFGDENDKGLLDSKVSFWETLWIDSLIKMRDKNQVYVEAGHNAYEQSDWNEAIKEFQLMTDASESADVLMDVFQDHSNQVKVEKNQSFLNSSEAVMLYWTYAKTATSTWLELVEISEVLREEEASDTADIENLDVRAKAVQEASDTGLALYNTWENLTTVYENSPASKDSVVVALNESITKDLNAVVGDFSDGRFQVYLKTMDQLFQDLETEVQEILQPIPQQAITLLGPLETSATVLPERYPSRSLNEYISPALDKIVAGERTLNRFISIVRGILNNQSTSLENQEEIADFEQKAVSFLDSVVNIKEDWDVLEQRADNYIKAAKDAEIAANDTLSNAREAIALAQETASSGRENNDIEVNFQAVEEYNTVLQLLDNVDSLYLRVLVNDLDILNDSNIDENRKNLRSQVQAEQNRVTTVVRLYAVERSRSLYRSGDFEEGETLLTRSLAMWNSVYNEDDGELSDWLKRLKNAGLSERKSVVEPSDPLYSEMNQYLNLADRYFKDGVRIKTAISNDGDAQKSFQAARDLVTQVLTVFPANDSALFLEQKIFRQTDAEAWEEESLRIVNEARSAVNRDDVRSLIGTAQEEGLYAQLRAIQSIDPNFQGLKNLIYNVRIAVGEIERPIDPADIARSRSLTEEARAIWENIGLAGSNRAVLLLNTALRLWLDNNEASQLRSEILLNTEPERLPALPPQLLNLMNLIEDNYSKGDFILADALMDRVFSEYARYTADPRIKALREKINQRL